MDLLEQVKIYQSILEEKESLKELTKANNERLQEQRDKLAGLMVESEVAKINLSGYTYCLQSKTKYSKKEGADETLIQLLRQNGLDDLVRETVNANTLQGAISELVENRGELPEEFADCISVYEFMDIVRRKDKSAALK